MFTFQGKKKIKKKKSGKLRCELDKKERIQSNAKAFLIFLFVCSLRWHYPHYGICIRLLLPDRQMLLCETYWSTDSSGNFSPECWWKTGSCEKRVGFGGFWEGERKEVNFLGIDIAPNWLDARFILQSSEKSFLVTFACMIAKVLWYFVAIDKKSI